MFKKSLASIVSAAILVAGPGNLTLTAAAQTLGRAPVTGVSVTPTIGTGFNSPVPGASSLYTPTLTPGALIAPALMAAPSIAAPAPVAAVVAAAPVALAVKAMPAAAVAGSPLSVIKSQDAKVGVAEKGAALNALFENSAAAGQESLEVLGQAAASVRSDLAPYDAQRAAASFPVNSYARYSALQKAEAAGSISDVTNLFKRAWNAVLGMLGIGVKKMETPEVMAQRIIDQLNAAKPVYNRKVQEASTLVEKLKLQVEGETAKVAELEKGITALLSDSDAANDIMASGMINQQKTLNASIASTNEQIGLAELTLTSIKEERARFFSEREETMAKIQAGLTKSAAADIQKQIAELKGGFQVGDLKDNMDKFEDAVNDKVADAKGTVDSVESNPDQILKKAKDSLKSQEIKDELARRKAAIEQAKKDKGAAGGAIIGTMKAVGIGVNVVMAVWAGLNTGWIAMILGAGAVMGVVMPMGALGGIALGVFAEKVLGTSGAKTAGMGILGAVIGFGLGVVAVGFGGYVGYAVASQTAAIALGAAALVTSLLDVAFKFIFKNDKPADKAALSKVQWENLKRYDVVLTLSEDLSVTQEDAVVYFLSRMPGVEYTYDRENRTIVVAGIEGRLLTVLSTMGGVQSVATNGESKSDKSLAGGKVGSYPAAVYILGSLGFAVSLIMPVTALAITAVLGALTLVDNLSAAGNLDKSTKFYAFSIGSGVAALITLGISGFGVPFFLAGGAAVLANALGKVHKAISLKKSAAGGLILELGIGAAVIAVIAMVSAPFRNLLARAWNAMLGIFGMGVKKMETPEVMAQRIIDQLNAQKPVYNRKVQEASTLVEKLRLQIEKQSAQSAELDRSVTAILSDSDPLNDVMAESLLNQKKTVDASTAMTQEQLTISEKTLVSIKEERASFFSEREEMLAKIQAGLTKSKSAEIQKQIAELKGGFQVGDLKDNMDRFEDAVNDKVADAKGTADSVESNPDQILKKAKDTLKNQEVQDEIAKRKAAIEAAKKAKGAAGGAMSQGQALGYFAKVLGIGFALISPMLSAVVFAAMGGVALVMAPEQGRWLGRQLAVIGIGTLVVGGVASLAVAKLGLAVGAFSVGIGFVVPAGIALAAGVIATIRAKNRDASTVASVASSPAGSSVISAPVAAPVETSAPAASTPKASFSIKPLLDLIARAWNAVLGILGMGVKKMETPEILAQRLIDQLDAARPIYNNKVREASTLVEKLRQQIAGEQAKIADFDKTITALLSDNDASNDIQAAGLLNSQKTLEASVAASKDQLASSEQALSNIKEERARFFSEREETLAKIQSALTKVKAAEISKQIAELKGGFQIGDLKDNMDRFDGAVNDKIADAKGTVDSVESNPDQVLKKAKDSLRTQEVADELARRKAAIEQAKKDKGTTGGLILELGIGAAVIAVIAMVSAPFRNLLARAWNAMLGIFGMGVKKMETPEVMAQRIIDQLNAQKPVYNRKVQEASTLVEKLRLQIEKQSAQSAELDRSVTAILSDSDPLNDVMAESLLNQKKTVDASTAMTQEQLAISEKTLVSIKEERASFFSEREEMLAKIQAGLTKSKSAEIQKQIAELKGGFQVGDLKDNMDRFEDAVNDKVADAKGTVDSVESNPDQILKKAKDSLKNQEVQDELAKRKAAIEAAKKAKGSAGGFASALGVLPLASLAGLAAIGWLALGGLAGFVAFAVGSYVYLEHIKKAQKDMDKLFFAVVGYGVLGAALGGLGALILFL